MIDAGSTRDDHGEVPERAARDLGAPLARLVAVLAWIGASIVWPALVRIAHMWPRLHGAETRARVIARDRVVLRGSYAPGRSSRAVLLVHGYADGRRRWNGWAAALQACGVHIARFDHRGHGTSGGVVVSYADREVSDVIDMVRWLRQQPGVAHVSILATSMGAGAVLAAAPQLGALDVDALVLLAPASDYRAIAADVLSERTLRRLAPFVAECAAAFERRSFLELAPIAQVGSAALSTLIFHSRDDETIAARHTEAAVEAHPAFRVAWLHGVRHADTPRAVLEQHRAQALNALRVT